MKKHLIAAAVAATIAAPAMAQNVSVYGIIDMNWSSLDTDGATGTNSAMSSSALATSRLGFRGSEDLGGGLKAEFQLEGKMNPETGSMSGATFFDRESWVGLSGNFGAVRFGTTDVTNTVNIDARTSQIGDLGLISDLGTDKTKSVRYTSPKLGNFQVEVGTASPNATTASENTNDRITSLFGSYEAGALGVYVGHEIKKVSNTYDQDQTTIGAKYDFGTFSTGVVWATRDGATSADKDFDQVVLSVAAPLGNGLKIHGAYETYKTDTTASNSDFKAYTVALTKAMSKRTSLYAAYIDTDKKVSSQADTKQYTVGVVHSF